MAWSKTSLANLATAIEQASDLILKHEMAELEQLTERARRAALAAERAVAVQAPPHDKRAAESAGALERAKVLGRTRG